MDSMQIDYVGEYVTDKIILGIWYMSEKKPKKMEIKNSKAKGKRYAATFYDEDNNKLKTVNFGAKFMDSYPIHKDE